MQFVNNGFFFSHLTLSHLIFLASEEWYEQQLVWNQIIITKSQIPFLLIYVYLWPSDSLVFVRLK